MSEARVEFRIRYPEDPEGHYVVSWCDVHNIEEVLEYPEVSGRYVEQMWKSLVGAAQRRQETQNV